MPNVVNGVEYDKATDTFTILATGEKMSRQQIEQMRSGTTALPAVMLSPKPKSKKAEADNTHGGARPRKRYVPGSGLPKPKGMETGQPKTPKQRAASQEVNVTTRVPVPALAHSPSPAREASFGPDDFPALTRETFGPGQGQFKGNKGKKQVAAASSDDDGMCEAVSGPFALAPRAFKRNLSETSAQPSRKIKSRKVVAPTPSALLDKLLDPKNWDVQGLKKLLFEVLAEDDHDYRVNDRIRKFSKLWEKEECSPSDCVSAGRPAHALALGSIVHDIRNGFDSFETIPDKSTPGAVLVRDGTLRYPAIRPESPIRLREYPPDEATRHEVDATFVSLAEDPGATLLGIATFILARYGVYFVRTQADTGLHETAKRLLPEAYSQLGKRGWKADSYQEHYEAFYQRAAAELFESPVVECPQIWRGLTLEFQDVGAGVDPYQREAEILIERSLRVLKDVTSADINNLGNERGCYRPDCNMHCNSEAFRLGLRPMAFLVCVIDVEAAIEADGGAARESPVLLDVEAVRYSCPTHARLDSWELNAGLVPAVLDAMRFAEDLQDQASKHTREQKNKHTRERTFLRLIAPFVTCSNHSCADRLDFNDVPFLPIDQHGGLDPTCWSFFLCYKCLTFRQRFWDEALKAARLRAQKNAAQPEIVVVGLPPLAHGPTTECAIPDCTGRSTTAPPEDTVNSHVSGFGAFAPPDAFFGKANPFPTQASLRPLCNVHFRQFGGGHHDLDFIRWQFSTLRTLARQLLNGKAPKLLNGKAPEAKLQDLYDYLMPSLWHLQKDKWRGAKMSSSLGRFVSCLRHEVKRRGGVPDREIADKIADVLDLVEKALSGSLTVVESEEKDAM